jgi:hypothetical protein
VKCSTILLLTSMLTIQPAGVLQAEPACNAPELKQMVRDARTTDDFAELALRFDQRANAFEQSAQKEQEELDRLHALMFHPRVYAIQVETTQNRRDYDRKQSRECSERAANYRSRAANPGVVPVVVRESK